MNDTCMCGKKISRTLAASVRHPTLGLMIEGSTQQYYCSACRDQEVLNEFDIVNLSRLNKAPGSTLIRKERDGIAVDWNEYARYLTIDSEDTDCVRALRMAKLLTADPTDAWDIIADNHLHVGPRIGITYYYFARIEDAKEYARTVVGHNRFKIMLVHIDKVE